MPKRSAGILLHRHGQDGREVLLVHPGGPFWAKRDDGAWSIPKGEYEDGEDAQAAARREFEEELGSPLPEGAELRELGEVRQKNRKIVAAAPVGEAELLSWVGERVAHYKRPHAVRFADAIPRTPSGKVLRRLLRDREPAIVG